MRKSEARVRIRKNKSIVDDKERDEMMLRLKRNGHNGHFKDWECRKCNLCGIYPTRGYFFHPLNSDPQFLCNGLCLKGVSTIFDHKFLCHGCNSPTNLSESLSSSPYLYGFCCFSKWELHFTNDVNEERDHILDSSRKLVQKLDDHAHSTLSKYRTRYQNWLEHSSVSIKNEKREREFDDDVVIVEAPFKKEKN